MPVCPHQNFSISRLPPTPASSKSVVDSSIEPVMDGNNDDLCKRIKLEPMIDHWSTDSVGRTPTRATTPVRAYTPMSTAHDQPQLSKLTSWIITRLEAAVAGNPPGNLRLDNPVILQICVPAEQRGVPRQTPPVLPFGRSNFNGPLSSHPTHSSFNAEYPQTSPVSLTNLRSLSTIFPYASLEVLSSLQATYIALHYVSTINLPSLVPCSFSLPYTKTHSPLSSMSYIPAKARAMLGLQTPTARPGLPACWIRSDTQGWWERVATLEQKLRGEVVRLIGLCEGSDLGRNEALVRAVGQVVDQAKWESWKNH